MKAIHFPVIERVYLSQSFLCFKSILPIKTDGTIRIYVAGLWAPSQTITSEKQSKTQGHVTKKRRPKKGSLHQGTSVSTMYAALHKQEHLKELSKDKTPP